MYASFETYALCNTNSYKDITINTTLEIGVSIKVKIKRKI